MSSGGLRAAWDAAQKKPQDDGLLQAGNIDLANRPRVKNPDGSVSTVRSISANVDGHEVLMPTVSDDGRIMSNDEAVQQYKTTGKHLGIFKDPASATAYAQKLHEQQAATLSTPPGGLRKAWEAAQTSDTRTLTNHGASGTWGGEPPLADTSTLGNVSRAALQGATLGAGNKIVAAGNAAIDKLRGSNFGDAYQERLAAERAASHQFGQEHQVANLGIEAAGGLGSMLASGGMSAPQELATVGKLARVGKAAMTGLDLGAVSGAANADGDMSDRARGAIKGGAIGGIGGLVLAPVVEALGYAGNKLKIPEGASWLAQKGADYLPQGSGAQRALQSAANSFGTRGQAATEIGQRVQMDTKAGTPVRPLPANVPSMAIDQGGANLEGLASGVVKRPGVGNSIIRNALDERQQQMRPAVTSAFDEATGTNAAQGEALINKLADEHAQIDNTTQVAKAVTQDVRNAKPATAVTSPFDAWKQSIGGNVSGGLQQLRQMIAEQSAEAKQLFGAAREATRGQPMQSPTLDQIRQTPAGQFAEKWALAQKANRNSPLATVPGKEIVPAEMSAAEWATAQERSRARGMPVPSFGRGPDETVPDPETVHYMKQMLGKIARMGMNDGAQGTMATQAQGAVQQWGAIRNEMPEVWQQADAAFAKKARTIDAFNTGRNIMRTQSNPAGTARQGVSKSLDAVEQAHAAATPEEQQALRAGAQSAVTEYFRSGKSQTAFARQLQDPASEMSRRIVLATGDEQAPQRLAASMAPQVSPQHLLAPPAAPSLSPEGRGASLGLDVLRHGVSAPSNAPQRSLGMFDRNVSDLPAVARGNVQQGAAQALRGEFAGASGSVKSPGRVFDFQSPGRARQMSYAFPDADKADAFKSTIGGWDDVAARAQRITGGSSTIQNAGEQAARDGSTSSALSQLFSGNPAHAARSMVGGMANEATSQARQKLDEQIARTLTSKDPMALQDAMGSAQFRQRLHALLYQGLGGGSAMIANSP